MMKGYKNLYLIMQADYKHLCNSVVGHYVMYVKANSDVIAVTMATGQTRPSPKGTSF